MPPTVIHYLFDKNDVQCKCFIVQLPLIAVLVAEATNCTSSQWQCDNKQCIPAFWRCDSETDCHDSSDERNCLQSNSGSSRTCSENEFQCNMTGDCINKDWRCDQDEDCTDGSDEVGCEYD